MDLLRVNSLHVNFRTIDGILQVIYDVDLKVQQRKIIGLVGETGCGKSVTSKAILGALPRSSTQIKGNIFFCGNNLQSLSLKEREKILSRDMSYIPQDPMSSLNPVFTIETQMTDLLRWQGQKRGALFNLPSKEDSSQKRKTREQAIELLKKVEIPSPEDALKRYPCELSGGMRQRVLIAMALIGKPTFMVADEPTTSLDVSIQKGILELIAEKVSEEDLSILYITHNLGVARKLCDRIYVMYAGTITESADTKIILERPKHPYTQGLLKSIPKLTQEKYQGIEGRIPNYLWPPEGCRFHPRCKSSTKICQKKTPRLLKIENSHQVACHHVEKGDG